MVYISENVPQEEERIIIPRHLIRDEIGEYVYPYLEWERVLAKEKTHEDITGCSRLQSHLLEI